MFAYVYGRIGVASAQAESSSLINYAILTLVPALSGCITVFPSAPRLQMASVKSSKSLNETYKLRLSICVPVFNDEDVLQELVHRLHGVLDAYARDWKLILIDDGSSDGSWSVISALQAEDDNIIGLKLMRNFGQQNAIAAGLDYADGDIVVIMDSDRRIDRGYPKMIATLKETMPHMAIAK